MQKSCVKCGLGFEVDDRDMLYYNKISPEFDGKKHTIPPPTHCPDCRQQRRMVWRGKDYFFRKCSKTGENCLSIFPEDVEMVTYSEDAYTSDNWNGLEWGRDFDFSRPFFEQYFELWYQTPKQIANAYFSENSEFTINAHRNKDCYLVDEIDRSRDCMYGYNIQDCVSVVNCFYARKSELCYESSQIEKCYEVFYSQNTHNCSNSAFLFDCQNCRNCLFCVNLRNAQYQIFNKEVGKEEFERKWSELFTGSQNIINHAKKQFDEFRLKHPVRHSIQVSTENCTGDQISNCQNCHDCFNIDNCRDCRYCTDIHYSRDAYDVHIYEGEIMYECLHAGPEGYAQYFSHFPWFSKNSYYCSQLLSCNNVFGCSGLKHEEYCVFNKKYKPDDYYKLVSRIADHMKETGEWGEFFPASYSPFGYNQTMAQYYFPLSKEDALAQGFQWKEVDDPHSDLEEAELPENLSQISLDIATKALKSVRSGKRYRVIAKELDFHKQYGLPLPTDTPAERLEDFVNRNSRKLYDRSCEKCSAAVQTTYAPDSLETIYCNQCYNGLVY